jgi:hypothetical protein
MLKLLVLCFLLSDTEHGTNPLQTSKPMCLKLPPVNGPGQVINVTTTHGCVDVSVQLPDGLKSAKKISVRAPRSGFIVTKLEQLLQLKNQ